MTQSIKEVLSAEKKAQKIVEDAKEKAAEMISEAKIDTNKIIIQEAKKLEKEQEERISKKKQELEKKRHDILTDCDSKISKLEKNADKTKAEDFVLKEFDKLIK